MVTSLTRAAAHEAAGRGMVIPRQNIGTLHHFGFIALGRPPMAETPEGFEAWNTAVMREGWPARFQVRDPGKTVDGETFDAALDFMRPKKLGDDGGSLLEKLSLARARMTPRDAWISTLREFERCWTQWKRETGRMDFADLIDLAADVPCPVDGVQSIFVDESQDMSRLEMRLVRAWAEQADTLTIVGDSDQAIFTWRGADPMVMWDPPIEDRFVRVLEDSYRVPEAVHRAAMRWIRRMGDRREDVVYRPRKGDPGIVGTHTSTWRHPEALVDQLTAHALAGRTAMLLATCGYMLVPAISYMRKRGIPFSNPYRVSRGDWNPLYAPPGKVRAADRVLSFLRPRLEGVAWTPGDVWRWAEWLDTSRDTTVRGGKAKLQRVVESDGPHEGRPVTGPDLLEWLTVETVAAAYKADLAWWQEHLLPVHQAKVNYPLRVLETCGAAALRESPRLIVSTVHGVKGGEADVVALFPDLDRQGWEPYATSEGGKDAVARLLYVAMTRSRDELWLAAGAGGPAVSWSQILAP